MEVDCHLFLTYLVYRFLRFDLPCILLGILGISFPMSLFEIPGITIVNCVMPGILHEKLDLTKIFLSWLPASMLHQRKLEFFDTRVCHSCSLKFFRIATVSILQICYGTCQSVSEGISETTNIKRILETRHRKMLNKVYQNWYTPFII